MENWKKVSASVRSISLDSANQSARSGFQSARTRFSSLVSRVMGPSQTVRRPNRSEKFHGLSLDIGETVRLRILNSNRKELLNVTLGESAPPGTEVRVQKKEDIMTVVWMDYAQLTICYVCNGKNPDVNQYDVSWQLYDDVPGPLQDSVTLGNNHWFSGSLTHHQTWPITSQHKIAPFVCCDSRYEPAGYGGVQEPYWFTSRGVGIYVDPQVPLFVSLNDDDDQQLTFVSKYDKPYRNLYDYKLFLKYSIYHGPDIRTVHDVIQSEHFPLCDRIPCKDLFKEPMWSTRCYLGADLHEENLMGYIKDIESHGFRPSFLEIGDDWTSAYGDMKFDPNRFPEPKSVMTTIKNKGFKIMMWVHPFASPRSRAFFEGTSNWVKSSIVEGVTAWEHGPAKLLDITSDDARIWFKKNLKDLIVDYDIDTFFFDFGQVNYLPPLYNTVEPISNPDAFSRKFAELAYDMCCDQRDAIIKVGVGTQKIPLMISVEDRTTDWGWNHGLKSIIPTALTQGLMGYPFVLPGVVGGRNGSERPSKELYLRWVAAVVLMPAMMFSVPPWVYGDDVVKMVLALLDIRRSYADTILDLAQKAIETGHPIVRPLWWHWPKDNIAMTIDTQFMLGEDVMVAPVVEKGLMNRAIYLPSGKWKDELRGKTVDGPKWLYSYRAKLGELPHFSKVPQQDEEEEEDIDEE